MAGFSRAPAAWRFKFLGINTVESADHVQPVQYPLATNIRGLADHSIRTRPGYDFLFSAQGDEPTVIPTNACSALTDNFRLEWTHNSRVGPFYGPTEGLVQFIMTDPTNLDRLHVLRSTTFGSLGSWTLITTFPAKTNEIASHDCHQHLHTDTHIHIAVQEAVTGRVSYARYALAAGTWDVTDNQVVASANTSFNAVGITLTSTGDIGILYETDQETVAAADWQRCGYRYSTNSGSTWSAELQVGNWGTEIDNLPGRPVADNAGRVQLFMGNATNSDFFGHYFDQTVRANHTLSSIMVWAGGTALSQIQSVCCMGDYTTFEIAGVTQIVWVGRMLFGARYTIFATSNDIHLPYQPADVRDGDIGSTFNGLGGSTYETSYPTFTARHDGTNLHLMAAHFTNSAPSWNYHKLAPSPYAPGDFTPAAGLDEDQAGPIFAADIPGQQASQSVITIAGLNYYVSLRDSGVGTYGLVYNWIREDQLPTSNAETLAVWAVDCSEGG